MRVLVTGHKGFVGSHFYRHYTQDPRNDVLGLDIVDRHPTDVRDFFRHSDMRFDTVIHCAAVVGGRQKIEGSPLDVAVDLAIDAELVQWALRTKPGRVVYFSSSAAYPTWLQNHEHAHPLREPDIDFSDFQVGRPDMTYGWVKLTGEYQMGFLGAERIKTHIFRPFSGYGPDQALDYPFPSFIERAATGADPFTIWGNGEQRRDFIHIRDIVGAVLAAIDVEYTAALNLGTGVSTSFNELAELVTRQAGYRPHLLHKLGEPVGVHTRFADTKRMNAVYTAKVNLSEGIEEALKAWKGSPSSFPQSPGERPT